MVIFKRLEHLIKQLVFFCLRPILRKGSRERCRIDGNGLRRVLFIRPEKIGDMVVTLPTFDALKEACPGVMIDIVASPKCAMITENDPRFDRCFLYRKRLLEDLRLIIDIRRQRYNCVVDMIDDDSVTGLVLSQLAAVGCPRIGIGKKRFAVYYDFVARHDDCTAAHSIDRALCVLDAFGIDSRAADRYAPPHISQDEFAGADRFMTDVVSLGTGGMTFGYNLSAGKVTRLWPMEKSRELITSILDRLPDSRVVLITVPLDRPRGDELERLFRQRVSQVPAGLSITGVAAIISRLDLLITPDTSLVHIARSLKIPVVGMYPQPSWNLERWRPYGQDDGVVVSDDDGHIFDISPEQVFSEVKKVIARREVPLA